MKLSVIIVNYNVRAYLEQCLRTVFAAMEGVDGEVYVVDNLSSDGSVEMVRAKFPQVKLIANTVNVGFSRANNQAIRDSTADYVVLLNPDTVVGEDVFRKVIAFLDAHPKAGGLGVKMIDGTGRFLPESKRGLPTPAVAFYKIIGLTRLLPRSRVFGRYHLGHLPEDTTAPIEILSGACMFLRKKTLDEVGLLDESFFMYGEDIDLSYRITLGGYENWYFPEARIIHYKGESTKKSSVDYVFVFYNAMAIFARKHFTRTGPDLLGWLITGSIYLSAAGAIVSRFFSRALLPLLDALSIMLVWVLLSGIPGSWYVDHWSMRALFVVATVGLSALVGGYDLPVRMKNVAWTTLLLAACMTLAGYSGWWPSGMRWWVLPAAQVVAQVGIRLLLHSARIKPFGLRAFDRRRILAIGRLEEARQALALLWQTHFGLGRQDHLALETIHGPDGLKLVRRWVRVHGTDEVVFCARDLSWARIIDWMEKLKRSGVTFKIAQPGREFIIGPNSIESLQDLHILEQHAVSSAAGRRTKRLVDVLVALLLLLLSPVLLLFIRPAGNFLRNCLRVLAGQRTWVGYAEGRANPVRLPALKPGVVDAVAVQGLAPEPLVVERVNTEYAKDYHALDDLRWVFGALPLLSRG
ncbi:MAG: glycosyltransferase [Flavobacteriales bacterium]|nr:glycosyltransferase [Flavobacteriales bacterium]